MTRWITLKRLVILLLLAWAGLAAAAPASRLDRIVERGELVLGTSGNMPPMTMTGKDGRLGGFDIDMARLMASMLDVRLQVRKLPFGELLEALRRGEVDVVISNMTITPKRNLQVAFVGPYLESGKCILTRSQALAKAEGQDINVPETRIAVMAGSTSERFARILLPRATLVLVEDPLVGVEKVKRGEAGGLLTDYPVCSYLLEANPDAGFQSVSSLLTYEPIGIALPRGDVQYINWTRNFLDRLRGTGILDELKQRWFKAK